MKLLLFWLAYKKLKEDKSGEENKKKSREREKIVLLREMEHHYSFA